MPRQRNHPVVTVRSMAVNDDVVFLINASPDDEQDYLANGIIVGSDGADPAADWPDWREDFQAAPAEPCRIVRSKHSDLGATWTEAIHLPPYSLAVATATGWTADTVTVLPAVYDINGASDLVSHMNPSARQIRALVAVGLHRNATGHAYSGTALARRAVIDGHAHYLLTDQDDMHCSTDRAAYDNADIVMTTSPPINISKNRSVGGGPVAFPARSRPRLRKAFLRRNGASVVALRMARMPGEDDSYLLVLDDGTAVVRSPDGNGGWTIRLHPVTEATPST
jgi:hypothetical protein